MCVGSWVGCGWVYAGVGGWQAVQKACSLEGWGGSVSSRSTSLFQHGWQMGCMHPFRKTASGKPWGWGSGRWQSMQMFGCAVFGFAAGEVEGGDVYVGVGLMGFGFRGSGMGVGRWKGKSGF